MFRVLYMLFLFFNEFYYFTQRKKKEYIEKLKAIAGGEREAAIISDSIYISDVGIDDIINYSILIDVQIIIPQVYCCLWMRQ